MTYQGQTISETRIATAMAILLLLCSMVIILGNDHGSTLKHGTSQHSQTLYPVAP